MPQVALDRVTKHFASGVRAVDEISLTVGDGELLALVGPSGSGKSTTLRIIAGLERPNGGSIRFGQQDVTRLAPQQRDVALVFQSHALYPHLSVAENMGFSLSLRSGGMLRRGWRRLRRPAEAARMANDRANIPVRVGHAAAALAIEPLLDRLPDELSGGEQQRVALGRAMVRQPKVLLLDEPLSDLDAPLRVEMRREIRRLHERLHSTTIYVTHDQAEAMAVGDRIAVLDRGRLQQIGTPIDVYERPANVFVASFFGTPQMNLLSGMLQHGAAALEFQADGWRIPLGRAGKSVPSRHVGLPIVLGVRTDRVRLGPLPSTTGEVEAIAATVAAVETLGDATLVHLTVGNCGDRANTGKSNGAKYVVCKVERRASVLVGEQVAMLLDLEAACWFDVASGNRLA